jgi:hypothetical protein
MSGVERLTAADQDGGGASSLTALGDGRACIVETAVSHRNLPKICVELRSWHARYRREAREGAETGVDG